MALGMAVVSLLLLSSAPTEATTPQSSNRASTITVSREGVICEGRGGAGGRGEVVVALELRTRETLASVAVVCSCSGVVGLVS